MKLTITKEHVEKAIAAYITTKSCPLVSQCCPIWQSATEAGLHCSLSVGDDYMSLEEFKDNKILFKRFKLDTRAQTITSKVSTLWHTLIPQCPIEVELLDFEL